MRSSFDGDDVQCGKRMYLGGGDAAGGGQGLQVAQTTAQLPDLNDLNNLDPNKIKEQVGDVDTDAVKDALGSQDLEEMQKQAMQVLNTVGKCKPSDDALKAHKASLVAITVHNAKLQGRTRIPEGTLQQMEASFASLWQRLRKYPFLFLLRIT